MILCCSSPASYLLFLSFVLFLFEFVSDLFLICSGASQRIRLALNASASVVTSQFIVNMPPCCFCLSFQRPASDGVRCHPLRHFLQLSSKPGANLGTQHLLSGQWRLHCKNNNNKKCQTTKSNYNTQQTTNSNNKQTPTITNDKKQQ